jgi:hypothetical protein
MRTGEGMEDRVAGEYRNPQFSWDTYVPIMGVYQEMYEDDENFEDELEDILTGVAGQCAEIYGKQSWYFAGALAGVSS